MADQRRPEPPPMRTNDVLVAAVGAAAWAVAFVVLWLVDLPQHDRWWLWVCVTGVVIGLYGMWQIPRIQRNRDALLTRNAARHQPPSDA